MHWCKLTSIAWHQQCPGHNVDTENLIRSCQFLLKENLSAFHNSHYNFIERYFFPKCIARYECFTRFRVGHHKNWWIDSLEPMNYKCIRLIFPVWHVHISCVVFRCRFCLCIGFFLQPLWLFFLFKYRSRLSMSFDPGNCWKMPHIQYMPSMPWAIIPDYVISSYVHEQNSMSVHILSCKFGRKVPDNLYLRYVFLCRPNPWVSWPHHDLMQLR